jgi:hypothetical protein
MSANPLPQPPEDRAAGFMILQYANATDKHRMRVHLPLFNPTTFAYNTAAGTETDVTHTFNGLVGVIKPFYTSDWVFTLYQLWQVVAGVASELYQIPSITGVAGTLASANSSTTRDVFEAFNMRSSNGGRFRLMTMGAPAVSAANLGGTVTPTSGMGSLEQAVVAYLTGANCAILAHDGGRPQGNAHVTIGRNRRLRRHFGYS